MSDLSRPRGLSAISEQAFSANREADWRALEQLLFKPFSTWDVDALARLSPLYRDVSSDLSRATTAGYSGQLVAYLESLTARAHAAMYARKSIRGRRSWGEWFALFPRAIRTHKWAMTIAFALFFVPFAIGLFGSLHDSEFAIRVAPREMLDNLADAYTEGFSKGRATGEGIAMAGYYVNNNVGIALRCFALGMVFGLGSALYLVYNGLATGAIMGYVAAKGAGGNILTFVLGHSSFELGAIIIAGGAGLVMGWSFVSPKGKSRAAALRAVAPDLVVLIVGAAVMLFCAAAIEAFWSASAVPDTVKRVVGGAFFLALVVYVVFGGRRQRPAGPPSPGTGLP